MKTIFNAVYVAIFLQFVRKIVDKVKVSVTHDIPVKHLDNSEEFYVTVNDEYFTWEESREDAMMFCWSAIAKCSTLSGKMKIVEHSEEHVLVAAESIRHLSLDEVIALNDTVDELG